FGQVSPSRATLASTAGTLSVSALNPGIYLFDDWDNVDPSQHPGIIGGTWGRRWNQVSASPSTLDWSSLESWIAREASLGKRPIIRITPHNGWYNGQNLDGTPSWVYAQGVPKVYLSDGSVYPQYWHATYRARMGEFIAAFGAKYDGDPRVEAVELGIGVYGEALPAWGFFESDWYAAGLTANIWEAYVKEVTDDYVRAFPRTPLIFMEQFFPQGDFWQMARTTDYAAERGVAMGFNGFRAEDGDAWYNYEPTSIPGWHHAFKKWVMTGQRLGRLEAHGPYNDPTVTYWAVLNALDSNATYISLYPEDITDSRNAEAFQFADKYAGKTLLDTPSLWVALRDETPGLWQPKPDNYGLGLIQYDPDNTSKGLWNVGGKEGRFARRTDQASGRNYLSFDVYDGYLYQSPGATVDITVTYLDQGYDSWELQYDATGNPDKVAGVVTKSNTGAWKKVTLVLADAYFGNRQAGNTDFRLYSKGDGDDILHMIELTKQPIAIATPTPLPTSTPTPALGQTGSPAIGEGVWISPHDQ
ncbi:MAG: hypothetical protein Q8P59_04870, partial [Dehalococcoidia bacterium]|nr:hypothetical protein [Dehalococcoidia bacterium]